MNMIGDSVRILRRDYLQTTEQFTRYANLVLEVSTLASCGFSNPLCFCRNFIVENTKLDGLHIRQFLALRYSMDGVGETRTDQQRKMLRIGPARSATVQLRGRIFSGPKVSPDFAQEHVSLADNMNDGSVDDTA